MRQIVLDTETTGLEPSQGHRIIEIGCLELMHRRATGNNFHIYLNPQREIDQGAVEVHGLTNEFLADKPLFEDVVDKMLDYLKGAELLIHNAPFDVGFLNAELNQLNRGLPCIADICEITDTLPMARKKHPGQKNSLDALCKRYEVDNSKREYHGALLDAELLAEVYLGMTGGQEAMQLEPEGDDRAAGYIDLQAVLAQGRPAVIRATEKELERHNARLANLATDNGGPCLWQQLSSAAET